MGHDQEVWPLFKFTAEPSLRSFIIDHLGKLRVAPSTLASRLKEESEVSIRRALIQSLGGSGSSALLPADRNQITQQLKSYYANDVDPGVHSSCSWALRQWGVELPELQLGEPVLTKEHQQRLAKLSADAEAVLQRLTEYEQEQLPMRQAVWERELREQPEALPASLCDGLVAHYPMDEDEGTEIVNVISDRPGGIYEGSGQPNWVPGIVDQALRHSQHASVGPPSAPKKLSQFASVSDKSVVCPARQRQWRDRRKPLGSGRFRRALFRS